MTDRRREEKIETEKQKKEKDERENSENIGRTYRTVLDRCTDESGLIFKTRTIHPERASAYELQLFFSYICNINGVENVIDIKNKTILSSEWWDGGWERDQWLVEAYKKIADGKVETKNLRKFVYLISGHQPNGSNKRTIWRLSYNNCKRAIDYLKQKDSHYSNMDYDNPKKIK